MVGLLAFDLTLVGLFFVPKIQTFVVNKITHSLSKQWDSEISIKDIRITPTLKIIAHDVCIKDLKHNDMIVVGTLKGRLLAFTIKPLKLKFGMVDMNRADVILRKYKGEETVNIAQWAQHIKKTKTEKGKFRMIAKKLTLSNSRFVLIIDDQRTVFDTKNHPDIDYGYFELSDIQWKSKKFLLDADQIVSISTKFDQLAFKQYGGFEMTECQGDFLICDTGLVFKNLNFRTEASRIDMDLRFSYNDWKSMSNFVDSVLITSTIRNSQLCMRDVAAFVPSLKGMDQTIMMNANRFKGCINNFSIIGLSANWGLGTRLHGDLALQNIRDFKHAGINLQLDSSQVSIPELANFKLPKGKTIPINSTIAQFGTTSLRGSFIGSPSIFNTKFDLYTNIGTIFANLSTNNDNGKMLINGSAITPNLNLGRLVGNSKILGTSNLMVTLNGSMSQAELSKDNFKTLKAQISGNINELRIYGYPLRNTTVEANYDNRFYTCEISSNDKYLACEINAQLSLKDQMPYLQSNIALDHFDASKMANAIAKIDSASAKGFDKIIYAAQQQENLQFGFDNFMIALRGSKLENLNGYAGCDNIRIINDDYNLSNERFRLTAINTDLAHKYIFSSNIANASVETNYNIKDIKDSVLNVAHAFFPTLVKAGNSTKSTSSNMANSTPGYLKLHVNTYRTRSVLRLFLADLYIAPNSNIDMNITSGHNNDLITADVPFVALRNKIRVHNLKMHGESSENSALQLQIQSDSAIAIIQNNNIPFERILANVNTANDTVYYNLKWHNAFNDSLTDRSNFTGYVNISNPNDLEIALRNSKLYLDNKKWEFNNENEIHIQNKEIVVHDLRFTDGDSKLTVNGTYSKTRQEQLTVEATDINLQLFNPLFAKFSIGGIVSANVNISNRNGKTFLYGKALANQFAFNEEPLGNVFLIAALDTANKVRFNGGIFESNEKFSKNALNSYGFHDFNQEEHIVGNIKGSYDNKHLSVRTTFDSLNAGFLEPFMSGFSDRFKGRASGKLDFYASPDSAYFDGLVHANHVEIGIAPLGMRYQVHNQDIRFNSKGIFFDDMLISDEDGNTALMNGSIKHKLFKDMQINLKINTNRIMVLNTPKTTNTVFYGKGYAAGKVFIESNGNTIHFRGPNLTTLSGSKIYLQVNSANSASQSDIITFKPKEIQIDNSLNSVANAKREERTALNFDFTFNVTNESDVVLLLESIGGTMNARADGRFQLTYNDNDNLNLYGQLSLHSGDFKLALYNVVNSRFTLVPGGTIMFDGPLDNMVVNISAYKTSKTSLSNIVPQEYLSGNGVNVNAYLHLNGPLMQRIEPTFSFELPNSSTEVRNMFYTAIDTGNTENITKQFVYFMVTNSFLPNDMFSSDRNASGIGASGLNMFSNIVNNVLGNVLSNQKGSFGVTYNQATETSSAEYGVKAGANLLNDRVTLETSIGYYDDKSTQGFNNMYGDFTVEYSINSAGTWKLKAYTYLGERDENYLYDAQLNYTAGVALAFKQDFNATLKRKHKQKKTKKHEQQH